MPNVIRDSRAPSLRITEIFYSLQGESTSVGRPTLFIRLTGCPLRCHYCDTEYAFRGGEWMTPDEILGKAKQYATRHVTVTGGEPLAQKDCLALLRQLADAGYVVSLETGGALDISGVDSRIIKVMDIKTPDSGEEKCNRWWNIRFMRMKDEIKFVISSRKDYEWAREKVAKNRLDMRCEVLFSPAYATLEPARLAGWILEDRLSVRFQLQLHKMLWGERPGC